LLQGSAGAGEPDADDRVEPGHVDAELESIGACEPEQVAVAEPLLELAPLLGQIAAAVGRHRTNEGRVHVVESSLRSGRHRLGATPRPHEHQRSGAADHQVGEDLGCLGVRRAANRRLGRMRRAHQWRFPQGDGAGRVRRRVIGDGDDIESGEAAGEVGRLGHGRRRQDEHRVGAVVRADAAQPAQDVRDVRTEHPAVVVALVDHHVPQPTEQARPPSVAREYGEVQCVGVGQRVVGVVAGPVALVAGVVAVDGRCADELRGGREPPSLIRCQGLGRGQVQNGG
jgi:hypothetical protein